MCLLRDGACCRGARVNTENAAVYGGVSALVLGEETNGGLETWKIKMCEGLGMNEQQSFRERVLKGGRAAAVQ